MDVVQEIRIRQDAWKNGWTAALIWSGHEVSEQQYNELMEYLNDSSPRT